MGDGRDVVLALLGTVGLGGWFVKIRVVLKAFCVVAIVVVVAASFVVVVVVVAVVVVVVEVLPWAVTGCAAACRLVAGLEINGADVAGAEFGCGVSLAAERLFAVDSPEIR